MALDMIKGKIDEIVDKVKNDKDLMNKFKSDPIKTVESLIGIDLPDDVVSKIVDGVKAKLASVDIGSALGGLFGKK